LSKRKSDRLIPKGMAELPIREIIRAVSSKHWAGFAAEG
jgi:hypothetical protein